MRIDEDVPARPSPALRPYVARYGGYRQRGLPPGCPPTTWLAEEFGIRPSHAARTGP